MQFLASPKSFYLHVCMIVLDNGFSIAISSDGNISCVESNKITF